MTLTRFADVFTIPSTRTADPIAAGIERSVGLEHIEPENLHIRSWGFLAGGTTFTNTFQRGQVQFGKCSANDDNLSILLYVRGRLRPEKKFSRIAGKSDDVLKTLENS